MKFWLSILVVFLAGTVCMSAQDSINVSAAGSFLPRFCAHVPTTQVETLLKNLAGDTCQKIITWKNNGYNYWQFCPPGVGPDMLITKLEGSENCTVFTKTEYVGYFGKSVKFLLWEIKSVSLEAKK